MQNNSRYDKAYRDACTYKVWDALPYRNKGLGMSHAGIKPFAGFVNCYGFDGYMESIDMLDAFHPQTLFAYGMNGNILPLAHGFPLRLRVETQVGYKSVKYLEKIVITDYFVATGDSGWAWYVGL